MHYSPILNIIHRQTLFNFKQGFVKPIFNCLGLIIIHYIYIALFSALKVLYIEGESTQPPSMCSIHLDDVTAPHTSLQVERRQSNEANQYAWGWLGGHDGQRPKGKFGKDDGVTLWSQRVRTSV